MVCTVLQSLRSLYKKQLHQYLKSFPAGKDVRSVMLSIVLLQCWNECLLVCYRTDVLRWWASTCGSPPVMAPYTFTTLWCVSIAFTDTYL